MGRAGQRMRRAVLGLMLGGLLGGLLAGGTWAQEAARVSSPILTIESERLLTESLYGKRLAAGIDARSADLAAENRRIEAELIEEERSLTEKRKGMDAGEFRKLADAFDAKVVDIRREQDGKARALGQTSDETRREVLVAATPILQEIMYDAGAAVIVERRSVFMSADVIDVTDRIIARMDQELGDGSKPEAQAPATPATPSEGTAPAGDAPAPEAPKD